jgi:hypothetical protein
VGLRADQGTTAAAFLKLDTSPRAVAMGDAYTGVADDVSAIEYNPAGMAYMTQKDLTVMQAFWFQDIYYDYAALAWPIKGIGTFAADVFYLNAGTFNGYVFASDGVTPVSTGTFTAADMYGTLSYSRKILDFLSAGLSVKMLDETIATYSTGSVAVALSGYYKTPVPRLNLGLTISNLGPSEGFSEAFSLPINVRFGVGYKPLDNIQVAMDYTQPIETAGIWSVGGEYGYRNTLYVRMGYEYQGAIDYNQTYAGYGPSVAAGLKMGLGLKLYKNYSADYSYAVYGFLGTSNNISLSMKFD